MAANKAASAELSIQALTRGTLTVKIIGNMPLFYNAVSAKAKRDLFLGSTGGKSVAAKKKSLRHDPYLEYHNSVYKAPAHLPTHLSFPASGFKASMVNAALETAGVSKAGIKRLLYVPGEHIPIWGVPQLRCDVVRNSGMNSVPDIRTRAFLPQWATEVEIHFVKPQLQAESLLNLIANAGVIIGIGDFRQEKGAGSFGTFRVVATDEDEALWEEITSKQGRDVQALALNNPVPANEETRSLLGEYDAEMARRAA